MCALFSEFDAKSDHIEFIVSGKNKTLTLATSCAAVSNFSVEIPSDSEIVSHFHAAAAGAAGAAGETTVSSKYQFSLLKHALKPMPLAEKVSIRIDSRQFLSIQYMIKLNDTACFMEFYCAPDISDDDDDDEENESPNA